MEIVDHGHSGVALSGTPGVGLSCFLDFCLHMLLVELGERYQSVLYIHGKEGFAYIYRYNSPVERISRLEDMKQNEMAQHVDFVLIDPPTTTVYGDDFLVYSQLQSKKFILAASLDRQNCKALRQEAQSIDLFLGPTTMEESLQMRRECYPEIPREVVEERFQEFGGIPRFLFAIPSRFESNRRPRQDQTDALEDLILHPRRIDSLTYDQAFESVWALYHMSPRAKNGIPHSDYTIVPCCDDARVRIRNKLMEINVWDLWSIFKGTSDDLDVLKGIRYEAYAHKKILRDGLKYEALLLTETGITHDKVLRVEVPPQGATVHLPDNNLDVGLRTIVARERTNGAYLLPTKSNFPVVNSFYVPLKCHDENSHEVYQFQMMAGRNSNPLSHEAGEIFDSTGSNRLIFVVPKEATIKCMLPGAAGAPEMNQYRIVLNEAD
jgi:hypothetical protein